VIPNVSPRVPRHRISGAREPPPSALFSWLKGWLFEGSIDAVLLSRLPAGAFTRKPRLFKRTVSPQFLRAHIFPLRTINWTLSKVSLAKDLFVPDSPHTFSALAKIHPSQGNHFSWAPGESPHPGFFSAKKSPRD